MNGQNIPELLQANAIMGASNQKLQETIDAMAVLIATMQQRDDRLHEQVRQQLQRLQDAVNSADLRVNRMVESALPRLVQLSQQALAPAAERFDTTLATAGQRLEHTTRRFAHAQQSLETAVTRRMWAASAAMLAAGVLSMVAAGYALYAAKAATAEAAQYRAEVAYLDRVMRADLVPCGKDRLCAAFEKNGPRYGNQRQYRAINLRAAPAAQ
ncbi:hypothetical protein LL965_15845 [Xanthomonas cassavae CFBP 4642]|uniref:Relaxation protein n=1 Tax=Xanthomonas cassavae CFBP 4642 TaxID=1219375 RepID=A0ABS8HH46_9XANT|nr:hypothetical protein [Xanthomonas cassavae]MCC4621484.1 hypothetical protein [Xanthomonas cassavae CFBP 4642]